MLGGLTHFICVRFHSQASQSQPARGTPCIGGGEAPLTSACANVQDWQMLRICRRERALPSRAYRRAALGALHATERAVFA